MKEKRKKKDHSDLEAQVPLCPVCGKELTEEKEDGYACVCGEFIPRGMAIIPHRGVTCKTLGRWGQ